MTEVVVADTGPLIALARVGQLGLLQQLYGTVIVPTGVRDELQLNSGRPGARALAAAFSSGWIRAVAVSDPRTVIELKALVDQGEAEAIALMSDLNARFLLIDDARGRRIASARAIPVVGVAGVLLAAKSRELVPVVAPILEALASAGYRLSDRLLAGVLHRAGESRVGGRREPC